MALKLRSMQMSRLAYVAAHSEFEKWLKRQLTVYPVETDHFHYATAFCNDVAG